MHFLFKMQVWDTQHFAFCYCKNKQTELFSLANVSENNITVQSEGTARTYYTAINENFLNTIMIL